MPDTNTTSQQTLIEIEKEFLAACLTADVKKLDGILAEQFIFTDPYGLNLTKSEWLEGLRTGGFKFESIALKKLEITVSTNIAWARADVDLSARSHKASYAGAFSALDIYEKLGGRWRLILSTANQLLPLS
jgi:hypothetical protein